MSVVNFSDALILHGSYDVSADHNDVKLETNIDVLEATRFGHTTHINTTGLPYCKVSGTGWLQIDDSTTPKAVDANLWGLIGATDNAFTLAPSTADTEVAYVGKLIQSKYTPERGVATLGKFTFEGQSNRKFARGRLLLPLASRAASNNGTDFQLGAVSSTQKLVANLHVTAFSGTSLVVRVRSAASSGMAGSTNRITFATATAVTSEYQEISGPITDTWYDIDWTITAATATFAVSVGIRS